MAITPDTHLMSGAVQARLTPRVNRLLRRLVVQLNLDTVASLAAQSMDEIRSFRLVGKDAVQQFDSLLQEAGLNWGQVSACHDHRQGIQARTALAEQLYVACLSGQLLNKWPGSALDNLAKECARAALHFSMADAVIHDHYHQLRQEAKDGHAQAD